MLTDDNRTTNIETNTHYHPYSNLYKQITLTGSELDTNWVPKYQTPPKNIKGFKLNQNTDYLFIVYYY